MLVFSTASYHQLVWSPTATAQSGDWGPLCWVLAFSTHLSSNWSGLQTYWLLVFTELYNSSPHLLLVGVTIWHSFNLSTVKAIISWLFLDRMHLLFTQVHFLFWQPGWVVGQYTTISHSVTFGYVTTFWRRGFSRNQVNVYQYNIRQTRNSTEQNSRQRSRIRYSAKLTENLTRLHWRRKIKKFPQLESIFGNKDYVYINQVVWHINYRKFRIPFQLQRTGNVTKGTWNRKLYFFNLLKNHVLLRGFLGVKVLHWKLNAGRFKEFLRDSCIKKITYFSEKLVHIKYKMEDFKAGLLEILKQDEQRKLRIKTSTTTNENINE